MRGLEFRLFHGLRKALQLLFADIHLLALEERVVDLVLLLLGLGVQPDPVEVLGGVRVHSRLVFLELSYKQAVCSVKFEL